MRGRSRTRGCGWSFGAVRALVVVLLLSQASDSWGQAFDCVMLNNDNTDIFTTPDECFTREENLVWCNCVSSLFTNPVRGEVTGLNQAVVWITDQQGFANHRIEVGAGTLDVSGLEVGAVIGETLTHELVPEAIGVPPSTFFTVKSEIRITEVNAERASFEVVVTELSNFAFIVLEYNPLDAAHSNGIFYEGFLESLGPGNGFVLEYRYPKDLVGPEQGPAIQIGDAADPGFNVRFRMTFFTEESGIYTLPDEPSIAVDTTIRRFPEEDLGEILPLGDPDLCQVLTQDAPCKFFEEDFGLEPGAANNPPTAEIVMLSAEDQIPIPDQGVISTKCGIAKIFFVGGNSDDGDGGVQGLSYDWSLIDGPDGGAEVPAETRNFKDTEITFTIPGDYEIRLTVDDGQSENNTAEAEVLVTVDDALDFNVQPTAIAATVPEPPTVELQDGEASVQLDATGSANGFLEVDDCGQELLYSWTVVSEPAPGSATIAEPTAAATTATFTRPGEYVLELEVDDQQEEDNTDAVEVVITVTGVVGAIFKRGDTDGNGELEVTDPINSLSFQFLGTFTPPCKDAADFDDNGKIELTDPISNLSHQFLGTAPPVAPGKDSCGLDPTDDDRNGNGVAGEPDDDLGCDEYPSESC